MGNLVAALILGQMNQIVYVLLMALISICSCFGLFFLSKPVLHKRRDSSLNARVLLTHMQFDTSFFEEEHQKHAEANHYLNSSKNQ